MITIAILVLEVFAFANRGGGPLLSYLALTGIVAFIVLLCALKGPYVKLKFGFIEILYFLFFCFFVFSLYASSTPNYGLSELLLFANTGILILILGAVPFSKKDFHWFSVGLIALAVADTLVGFFIYTQTAFPRFVGTFIDLSEPYISTGNDFANFILLVLPLAAFHLFKKHERVTTTLVNILISAVLFTGFLLSFSRGAWIAFVLTAILTCAWFVLRKKKMSHESVNEFTSIRGIWMRTLFTILLTILLVASTQAVRGKKFETISLIKKLTFQADEGGASASERLEYWQASVPLIKEEPLLGHGVGSFEYVFPSHQKTFGINIEHPHNIFLKIGVENGLFASVFFFLFLIGTTITILCFLWARPIHPALFLATGTLAALVHNLVDYNFIVANFTLFMVSLGLSLGFSRHRTTTEGFVLVDEHRTNRPTFIKKVPIYLLLILCVGFVTLGAYEGYYNYYFKTGRAALAEGNIEFAISRLENAKNLIFQRDLDNILALAYKKEFEKTHDLRYLEKEKTLLLIDSIASIDPVVFSRLAEIYESQLSLAKAAGYANEALRLDSANNLKYYFQVLTIQRKRGEAVDQELKAKTLALLSEYQETLRNNKHTTILTDNPEYASKLYGYFGLTKEQKEIDKIWLGELLKFTVKYGAPKTTAP